MKSKLHVIAFAVGLLFTFQSHAQTAAPIFPGGDLSTTKNHTGDIWLSELNVGDATFDPSIAQATYGPGAKLDWHIHPVVKSCSSPKELATIRNGENHYESSTRET